MNTDKLSSKLTLIFILFLLSFLLMSPKGVESANIPGDALKDYNSILKESSNALKAGNYLKSKRKLDEAALLLWNNSPLTAENVTFVKKQAKFYEDIIPTENKEYQPGNKLFLYLEPKNYLIKSKQTGKYQMDIVLDTKLIFEDGTIVFHNPEFIRFRKESTQPNREVKFDMYFNLTSGLKTGEYTIKNTLIDKLASQLLPPNHKQD